MAEINKEDIFGDNLNAPLQELQGTLEDVLGTLDSLRQSGKNMEKSFKESGEVTKATSKETKKLADDLLVLDRNEKKLDDTVKKQTKTQEQSASAFKKTTESLDQLAPAQAGAVKGFMAMAKAAAAFLMTPIGLAIAAIAAAIGSLTAYFKGSEEGQNRFNRAMAIGAEVLELITDYIEMAGEAIFNTLGKAFDWIGGIAEKVFPNASAAVKGWVDDIVKEGNRIADLEEKFNRQERELIIQRAEVARDASRLRNEAMAVEGQARLDLVNQAIALEQGLMDKEMEFAKTKLEIANKNASDDPTIENKKAQAEAIGALATVEQNYHDATKKFAKQKIDLENELKAAVEGRHRMEVLARSADIEYQQTTIKDILPTQEAVIQSKLDETAANVTATEQQKFNNDAKVVSNQITEEQIGIAQKVSNSLGMLAGTLRKGTIAQKVFANAQAVINTYLGATQVLRDETLPTVAKLFGVAAIIASGLSSIAKINSIKGFFKGTSSSPEGLAFVGERGSELMNVPGQGLMLSPSEATLTHLKRGTEIIPHDKSMAMLAGSGIDVGKTNNFLMLNHLQLVNDSVKQIGSQIVNAVESSNGKIFNHGSLIYEMKSKSDGSKKMIRLKSLSA